MRRELFEGTGVDVQVDDLTGVYRNMPRGIVALVFRGTALSPPLAESKEAAAIFWIPLPQIEALMLPAYAIRVLDALRTYTVPARAHDGTRLIDSSRQRALARCRVDLKGIKGAAAPRRAKHPFPAHSRDPRAQALRAMRTPAVRLRRSRP